MTALSKSDGKELVDVGNVSVDVKIAGELQSQITLLAMFFFVDLNDANQRLVLQLWVVIKDHVEAFIDCTNTLSEHLVERLDAVLKEFDVFAC